MRDHGEIIKNIRLNLRIRKWPLLAFMGVALFARFAIKIDFSFWVLILAFIMFVLNCSLELLDKKGFFLKRGRLLHSLHLSQLIFDLVIVTIIIHYVGGVAWLGFILYTFYIVYVTIAFSQRDFFIILSTIIVSYTALVLLEYSGAIKNVYLFQVAPSELHSDEIYIITSWLLTVTSFIFIAFLAKIPAERLESTTTKLNEIKESLEKSNLELGKLDEAKSAFISLASHQLRTPLSGMRWGLADLRERVGKRLKTDELKDYDKIIDANNRVVSLVNDLLNISRIEEKKFNYEYKPSSIEGLIKEVCGNLISLIAKKKIKISLDFPKGGVPKVMLDYKKMTLAIENVIENSIKYNNEGGLIKIKLNADGEEIKISISDSGLGIPNDQQPKIFSKFFRADNVVRHQTEGTGLGLYIVKSIILNHRGRIWFTSKEKGGTTFYIVLPVKWLGKS